MIPLFVTFGLLLGFLSYSTYFSAKVSKGVSVPMLFGLVYGDPISDPLLYYTFYNLLWCRLFLMVAWCAALVLGGLIYGFLI
jgi:hypothetical protein